MIWPYLLLSVVAGFLTPDRRYFFLGLPSVLYILLLANADPVVGFDNRFFLPAFALILPLTLKGISDLLLLFLQQRDKYYYWCLYGASLCFAALFIPWMTLSGYNYFTRNPVAGEHLREEVVQWLDEHISSADSIVLADSGLIPYASKYRFIDSYCLNNKTMALYPGKDRYALFCKQMLVEKPEVIILTSLIEQGKVLYTPADVCLKQMIDETGNYKLSGRFSTQSLKTGYRYELFTKS